MVLKAIKLTLLTCVPPAVPDPPENLRWRDKSASGIFLTWEPPKYDGGAGIKGYNVDRCQRGTDKWEACGDMVPELKYEHDNTTHSSVSLCHFSKKTGQEMLV